MITFLLAAVATLTVAACGSPDGSPSSPTSTPSMSTPSSTSTFVPPTTPPTASPTASAPSTPDGLTVVSVYFMRGQFVGTAHRGVPATNAPAGAAVRQLLAGPTSDELAAGLHTQVPPGTRLLGLTIRDRVATVDLSGVFSAGVGPLEDRGRLAQVVYTLTQFPSVRGVRFRIDGEPLVFRSGEGQVQTGPQTRRAFEDVTPAIFAELPAVGDRVGSPLVITGTANTFEAQFFARVRDAAGRSLVNQSVMATSGSGTRGTFNEALAFSTPSESITLELYEASAADGRPIHMVRIPLLIAQGGVQ